MISFLKFIALLVGSYYILALIFAFIFLIIFAVVFAKSFKQSIKDHQSWKGSDRHDI